MPKVTSSLKMGGDLAKLWGGNGNGKLTKKPTPMGVGNRTSELKRVIRRLALVGLTGCLLAVCRWVAYQLRFDFDVPDEYLSQLRAHWLWTTALQLAWLTAFRQFSGIYKYFSLPEIRRLAYAMILSGITLFYLRVLDVGFSPPRGVILLQCMTGFLALGAMRSAWRVVDERYLSRRRRPCERERKVAIIGAGDAGAELIRELYARPNLGLVPVALFDDDGRKWGSEIHGIPVLGAPDRLPSQVKVLGLEQAVIAMPSAPARRIGEVVGLLQKTGLRYVTVPSIDQLTSGTVQLSQLRPVKIEDLLGRESIDLRLDEIGSVMRGRPVLVTGAGGSIGSELCRQVASFHPSRLILVDQSEVQLFQIEQQLIELGYGDIIVPVVADILDQPRMGVVLRRHQPAVIYHAAAHKHVSMMEQQPCEAIKNNSLGTAGLMEMAVEHGVERFVLISTDKAVNPTSVMGASKRLAEMFLQSFAQEYPGKTKFVAVRFGNVLGSSGSVVPIFEHQIAAGGPITVTDPEVVRFFMTIPEAVGLVLQSCAQGAGGEVFVLDMGKPVKIAELARQMIRLSGLEPDRDIEIKFIGLRPGEKLYEELHHLQANCTRTAHGRIKRLTSKPVSLRQLRVQMHWLSEALHTASADELKRMLKVILPEYTPSLSSNGESASAVTLGDPKNDLFANMFWAVPPLKSAPLAGELAG